MNGETYYIDTKDISLQQTNAINQYIAETLAYSHSEITDSIEKSFEQSAYKTSDVNLVESLFTILALMIQLSKVK